MNAEDAHVSRGVTSKLRDTPLLTRASFCKKMNERILHHYLEKFRSGSDVEPAKTETLFDALISGENEILLAELLQAWNEKGTTEDEIFEFALVMRRRMKRINSRHETFVDTVGTGGSKTKTFNVSTAAAFVIAGAGVAVAKHGNRAATSNAGSADVLSLLGINVDVEPEVSERHLDQHGICFMFAPNFHFLSPTLAKARRSLSRPTIFNNLGPLCNPASAPHQVIGVWSDDVLAKTANVLARLGTSKSWIVHGENGLDEIALIGKTFVAEIIGSEVRQFEIDAEDFGIDNIGDDLPTGCSAQESAEIIRQILVNENAESDAEKLVLINAAAAIYIAGHAASLSEACEKARNSIRSGAANEKLTALAAEANK